MGEFGAEQRQRCDDHLGQRVVPGNEQLGPALQQRNDKDQLPGLQPGKQDHRRDCESAERSQHPVDAAVDAVAEGGAHQGNSGGNHCPVIVADSQQGGDAAGSRGRNRVHCAVGPNRLLLRRAEAGPQRLLPGRPVGGRQHAAQSQQDGERDGRSGRQHALPQRRMRGHGRDGSVREDVEQGSRRAQPPVPGGHRPQPGYQRGAKDNPPGIQAQPGGQRTGQDHNEHQCAGTPLVPQALAVRLITAVDAGECTEGHEDRQVDPADGQQDGERDTYADAAADAHAVVIVGRGKGEHFAQVVQGDFGGLSCVQGRRQRFTGPENPPFSPYARPERRPQLCGRSLQPDPPGAEPRQARIRRRRSRSGCRAKWNGVQLRFFLCPR